MFKHSFQYAVSIKTNNFKLLYNINTSRMFDLIDH